MKKVLLLVFTLTTINCYSKPIKFILSDNNLNIYFKLDNELKPLISIPKYNSFNENEFLSAGFGIGQVSNELGFGFSIDRFKKKVGFSFDLLLNFGPPENQYYENISLNTAKNTYNDKQLEDFTQSLVFNFGPNFKITNSLYLITGISISSNSVYTKFYDSFEILGKKGNYYVDNKSYTDFGFYGGLYYRTNNKTGIKVAASTTNTIYFTYNFIIL